MNTSNILRAVFVVFLAVWRLAAAQDSGDAARLAQVEAQMLSSWWGTVEGEVGPRIMRITAIGPRADGHFRLDLNYGILGGGLGPLKGTLYRLGNPASLDSQQWVGAKNYKIEFATGAGTLISAESAEPGVFVGTFAPRSGGAKPIRLERVSEEEIQARVNNGIAGRRAAAEKWLAKDEIKIDYKGSYTSTFTVDMKAKTVMFYGGEKDNICTRAPVPAEIRVDGTNLLVFTFDSKMPGCAQLQYIFDPVSRGGVIRQRPPGSSSDSPWSGPSRTMVWLVE